MIMQRLLAAVLLVVIAAPSLHAVEPSERLSDPALEARVCEDARKLCRALGYEMNTVELAIRDGVPYAIDFMNSAPDFDVTSLGELVVQKIQSVVGVNRSLTSIVAD